MCVYVCVVPGELMMLRTERWEIISELYIIQKPLHIETGTKTTHKHTLSFPPPPSPHHSASTGMAKHCHLGTASNYANNTHRRHYAERISPTLSSLSASHGKPSNTQYFLHSPSPPTCPPILYPRRSYLMCYLTATWNFKCY